MFQVLLQSIFLCSTPNHNKCILFFISFLPQIGNVIYGRLLVANRDMEPELVCMDSAGRSGGLGVITGGNIFQCSLGLVQKVLSPQSTLMKHLGQIMPVEMAAGMNGRVWIRCKTIVATIAAMNAITNSEFMTEAEIRLMVHKLHDTILH